MPFQEGVDLRRHGLLQGLLIVLQGGALPPIDPVENGPGVTVLDCRLQVHPAAMRLGRQRPSPIRHILLRMPGGLEIGREPGALLTERPEQLLQLLPVHVLFGTSVAVLAVLAGRNQIVQDGDDWYGPAADDDPAWAEVRPLMMPDALPVLPG